MHFAVSASASTALLHNNTRLRYLNIPSLELELELRRLHTDLFWCYKVVFRLVLVSFDDLMVFRLDALALSVIARATWLAGWLAVTLRYCIKTAKAIGKLFRPSESPIILVF